jgi:hypothetical protein
VNIDEAWERTAEVRAVCQPAGRFVAILEQPGPIRLFGEPHERRQALDYAPSLPPVTASGKFYAGALVSNGSIVDGATAITFSCVHII